MARSGGLSHLFMGMLLQQMFGQDSGVIGAAPINAWFALSLSAINPAGRIEEPPEFVYLDADGLVTKTPTDDVAETGYARVMVPLHDPTMWMESNISAVVNADEIRFPDALMDWGSIRFWAMLDEDVAGRVLAYGALRRPVSVLQGDIAVVAPGSIHIALDSYEREW